MRASVLSGPDLCNEIIKSYEFLRRTLLLAPELGRQQTLPEQWLHLTRRRALRRLGRAAEAQAECNSVR